MKIQLDIPNELNKKLKIERIDRGFPNMETLILKILKTHKTMIETSCSDYFFALEKEMKK